MEAEGHRPSPGSSAQHGLVRVGSGGGHHEVRDHIFVDIEFQAEQSILSLFIYFLTF